MKLIINIDEAIYEEAKNNWNYLPLFHCEEIWKATADGTPIPDDATNGDILKAIFKNQVSKGSDIVAILDLDGFIISTFTMDWWNSPYKAESESQERSDKE